MNVLAILLYCFYAVLQMFIDMFVGMLSVWKNILDEKKSKFFSQASFGIVIPLFHIMKIANASTYDVLKLLWVIEINFIVSMIITYIISFSLQKMLKLDVRIKESFNAMMTFPAVGALPIVIGYGYCFPNGPIEHDPFCKTFQGIMMLSVLALTLGLYFFGTILLLSDKRNNENLEIKLKYIWHVVVGNIYNNKNYSVLEMFEKYYKIQENALKDFLIFEEKNKISDLNNNNNNNLIQNNNNNNNNNNIEYYNNAFNMIENNLDTEKKTEFYNLKSNVLNNLEKNPPIFPINLNIKITENNQKEIDKEFEIWLNEQKKLDPNFNVKMSNVKIDFFSLLKLLNAPPTNSFYLGLILGLSFIREIIFNSNNIFWFNFIDGINTISNTFSPFLFLVIGVACLPKNKPKKEKSNNNNKKPFLINKTHVVLIFLVRFVIIPIFGILAVWFWKEIYEKEIKTSVVFRLILFFPWCLPSSTTFAVVVNMTGYFFEEYGYLVMLQNFSCIVTLTLLNMIYFLIIGQ